VKFVRSSLVHREESTPTCARFYLASFFLAIGVGKKSIFLALQEKFVPFL
jgi:hypothetical protein